MTHAYECEFIIEGGNASISETKRTWQDISYGCSCGGLAQNEAGGMCGRAEKGLGVAK